MSDLPNSSQPPQYFITATSFDTEKELTKYPISTHHLNTFRLHPNDIQYYGGINATDITNTLITSSINSTTSTSQSELNINSNTRVINNNQQNQYQQLYNLIYFNNPHVGIEDLFRHISLLSHFFLSATPVLHPNGQIVVTLCDDQPNRWELFQCAWLHGYICIAAIELTHQEWPKFQNKRHQNDTAFPYNRMIQYYFQHRSTLSIQQCEALYHVLQSIPSKCDNIQNQNAQQQQQQNQHINNNQQYQLPPYFYRSDTSIWTRFMMLFHPSIQSSSSSPLSSQSNNSPQQLPTTQSQSSSSATNVSNWSSSDELYIPIFPILLPQYAFYPNFLHQYNHKHQQTSQSEQQLPSDVNQYNQLPIFNPILTFDDIIQGYKTQFQHITNPIEYDNYFTTLRNQLSGLHIHQHQSNQLSNTMNDNDNIEIQQNSQSNIQTTTSHNPQQATDSTSISPSITSTSPSQQSTQPTPTKTKSTKSTSTTPPDPTIVTKFDSLISLIPSNVDLPSSLDPKHLGRMLTSREIIKLERFVQRFPSKNIQQDNSNGTNTNHNTSQQLQHSQQPQQPQQSSDEFTCQLCKDSGIHRVFKTIDDLNNHYIFKHSSSSDNNTTLHQPNYLAQLSAIRVPIDYLMKLKTNQGTESNNNDQSQQSQQSSPTPQSPPTTPFFQQCQEYIQSSNYCTICSIQFPNQIEYDKHLQYLSPQQNNIKCQYCPRLFQNDRALFQHQLLKHRELV